VKWVLDQRNAVDGSDWAIKCDYVTLNLPLWVLELVRAAGEGVANEAQRRGNMGATWLHTGLNPQVHKSAVAVTAYVLTAKGLLFAQALCYGHAFIVKKRE